MLVKIDFVPLPVNYASDYAAVTTYMDWSITKVTFAGVSVIFLSGTSFIQAF
jgi:hypothetical protein